MPRGIATIAWILLGSFALLLGACASNDSTADGRPRETSIPWNRPASWEGPGIYGSAMNQQH
jgi:hypothetical protein